MHHVSNNNTLLNSLSVSQELSSIGEVPIRHHDLDLSVERPVVKVSKQLDQTPPVLSSEAFERPTISTPARESSHQGYRVSAATFLHSHPYSASIFKLMYAGVLRSANARTPPSWCMRRCPSPGTEQDTLHPHALLGCRPTLLAVRTGNMVSSVLLFLSVMCVSVSPAVAT